MVLRVRVPFMPFSDNHSKFDGLATPGVGAAECCFEEQRLKTPELNRIVPMTYKAPCFRGGEAKAEADVTGDRQWKISRQRRTYKILF